MSDQVFTPYYLVCGNRVKCNICTWEGEVHSCDPNMRTSVQTGKSLISSSDGYRCPSCSTVLAIRMSGFNPSIHATVTFPAGCDQEYLHIPVTHSVFSKR